MNLENHIYSLGSQLFRNEADDDAGVAAKRVSGTNAIWRWLFLFLDVISLRELIGKVARLEQTFFFDTEVFFQLYLWDSKEWKLGNLPL